MELVELDLTSHSLKHKKIARAPLAGRGTQFEKQRRSVTEIL
jgi:hypothetical protein